MKVGHLIAISSVTFSMVRLIASIGIWVYLLYMAFALNLHIQVAILTVLILTRRISRSLAKSTWGIVEDSGIIKGSEK